jgi:hypothetical protein
LELPSPRLPLLEQKQNDMNIGIIPFSKKIEKMRTMCIQIGR